MLLSAANGERRAVAVLLDDAEAFEAKSHRFQLSRLEVAHEVEALPWGSGSGFANPQVAGNGYVFCVQIGASEQP